MSKELVEWVAWGEKKPYKHDCKRLLTAKQKRRYQELQIHVGLQAAADYADKVGEMPK